MFRSLKISLLLFAAALSSAAAAQSAVRELETELSPTVSLQDIRPGSDFIGVARSRRNEPSPIAIWVPSFSRMSVENRVDSQWLTGALHDEGFAIGSISLKQRDEDGVVHAARVAQAIADILAQAAKFHIDPSRVVLVGQGWGGQLAALLATNPGFLQEAGISLSSLRGAVTIDGRGFDLHRDLSLASDFKKPQLRRLIGDDARNLDRLSPVHQAASPNAPIIAEVVTDEVQSLEQGRILAEALNRHSSPVKVLLTPRTRWHVFQTYLGHHQNPQTKALVAEMLRLVQ